MTSARPFPLPFSAALLVTLALSGAAGCGSRSDLDAFQPGGSGGEGGGDTTPTGSTTTGTGSTTTATVTQPVECEALTALSIEVVPTPGQARMPELQALPTTGEVLLGYIEASLPASGPLRFTATPAFAEWPPPFSGFPAALDDVEEFATGPGPAGPVGYIRRAGDSVLASQLYPELVKVDAPFQPGDGHILFAAAIQDRYLAAELTAVPGYHVLGVGSYQPGGLPQSEDPLVCTQNPVLGAGVPSGQGFLAAFTQPAVGNACEPSAVWGVAQVARYASSPELGSSLEYSESSAWGLAGEAIMHLAMAPASFGAWLVFQTDGATSETVPPVVAARLGPDGEPLPGDQYIPLTPGGYVPVAIAVAALGDTLAFVWVDVIDPGPPVIIVQLVRPDGSLGPATSFPTNEAWPLGRVRLLGSPAGNSLLVAWEAYADDYRVAMARIDCVGGI
jgi:hypothetical protein